MELQGCLCTLLSLPKAAKLFPDAAGVAEKGPWPPQTLWRGLCPPLSQKCPLVTNLSTEKVSPVVSGAEPEATFLLGTKDPGALV